MRRHMFPLAGALLAIGLVSAPVAHAAPATSTAHAEIQEIGFKKGFFGGAKFGHHRFGKGFGKGFGKRKFFRKRDTGHHAFRKHHGHLGHHKGKVFYGPFGVIK